MKILLDNNSFDFILHNEKMIQQVQSNFEFYYILSQEIELEKINNLSKKMKLKEIKSTFSQETAGVFMINAPCLNRQCYFVEQSIQNKIEKILIKHGCKKNNRQENFMHDLNLAITAYINKYTVLTNDGNNKKQEGLLSALRELEIDCFSHDDFNSLLLQTTNKHCIS